MSEIDWEKMDEIEYAKQKKNAMSEKDLTNAFYGVGAICIVLGILLVFLAFMWLWTDIVPIAGILWMLGAISCFVGYYFSSKAEELLEQLDAWKRQHNQQLAQTHRYQQPVYYQQPVAPGGFCANCGAPVEGPFCKKCGRKQ